MKNMKNIKNIKNMIKRIYMTMCMIMLVIPSGIAIIPNSDIATYYRGFGQYSDAIETSQLLKAADDWRDNIIPPGFSVSINTSQLLALADEWRNTVDLPAPVSLKTGTILKRTLVKGVGTLEIDNKVDSDAVISLARTSNIQESILKIYIRAADKYTISDIPDGTYIICYMSGKNWNSDVNKFSTINEISRFDKELIYNGSGNYIISWIVTLYPVAGGNATTTNIPESEFPN